MTKKTIRGVVTTTHLDEGETDEVEMTPFVQNLIDNGYVELVEDDKPRKASGAGDHSS